MPNTVARATACLLNFVFFALAMGLIATPAPAATRTVTSLNDSGAGTLRATIAAAAAGDTINFSVNGTITLTTGELAINRNLTITGPGSAGLAIRRSAATTAPAFRIFNIQSIAASISGLTIANGKASGSFPANAGGGILNDHGTLNLTNCSISGNSGAEGAGIFNDEGRLTLTGCTVSQNQTTSNLTASSYYGGGIFNNAGTLNATNCAINDNSGSLGAGLYNGALGSNAMATLTDCNFSRNLAYGNGGGIYNDAFLGNAGVTLTRCTLATNFASKSGGGIFNDGTVGVASLSLAGCIMADNSASDLGGGIVNDGGTLTLTGNAFDKNRAKRGGALYHAHAPTALTVSDCSFTGNLPSVGSYGGGIYNDSSTISLLNCSFRGLIVGSSSLLGNGGGVYNLDGVLTGSNCTFDGNGGSTANEGGAVYNGGTTARATFTHSTFANNAANFGAGIDNNSNLASVTNCTFANNASYSGGGLYNSQGTLTATNCTFAGNSATSTNGPGAGIENFATQGASSSVTLRNNLFVHGSIGANIFNNAYGNATIISQGHNLSSDAAGGDSGTGPGGLLNGPGDVRNTAQQLGPLQNNGGAVSTMALLPGAPASPAINAGDDAVLVSPYNLATDERGSGFPRRSGPHVDIGAYEFQQQSGAIFTVTTTIDRDGGVCGSGDCTLREAIGAANTAAGGQTVQFAPGLSGTITLTLGEIAITDTLALQGPGASVISVDGNGAGRIFRIDTAGLVVTMIDLTIRRGAVRTGTAQGGAIFNNGNLTMQRCSVRLNQATGGSGADGRGGAVYNSGTFNATGCTFSQNGAEGGTGNSGPNPGGNGLGAALYNGGTMTLANCTLASNQAAGGMGGSDSGSFGSGGTGGNGQGGAIYSTGSLTLTACTVASNAARPGQGGFGNFSGPFGLGQGGGVYRSAGTGIVRNTLVANNYADSAGPDAFGAFTSQGYNLLGKGDGSSGFTATGDLTGTASSALDARLGPLQDNGGPTPTMALLSGATSGTSPAIDKGKSFGLTTDERGQPRPINDPYIANASGGDGSDIGAYELQPVATFQFSATTFRGTEGTASATITVTRTGNIGYAATVNYATANGTATAGTDYTAAAGTISFAAGDAAKTFTVSLINNPACEPIENLSLSLNTPTGGTIVGAPATATLTLYDDDCTYSITGRVANNSGTGMPNVQITRTGGSNAVTDSSGNYTFTGVKQGNYTIAPLITPGLSGITFVPASYNVTVNTSNLSNISFSASYTVTGKVSNSSGIGIPNIQVTRKAGASSVTAVTNSSGTYTFTGVRSGSYTIAPVVTPAMTGISFFPTSTNVTVNTANLTNINFTAFFSISGKITNSSGVGMANVLVTRATGTSSTSVVTDANGSYSFRDVRSGTYTIKPSQNGKTFNPTSKSATVGTANLTNINFIGG